MSDGAVCVFGEVLFDHFPDGKRVLGGAPFNVAWHLQAFGQRPHFISGVGDDPEGEEVRAAMRGWGMDMSGLQIDPSRPTGRVTVDFVDGEPVYDIVAACAYDAVAVASAAAPCRVLYHGTLALRGAESRRTVDRLKQGGPDIVFVDVNLRSPWWERKEVLETLNGANWVKLNTDELVLLAGSEGQAREVETLVPKFVAEQALDGLILTHGSRGAEVVTAAGERWVVSPQDNVQVVDTVGAGDAFASVMILGLVRRWPLELALQRAQAFASALVGRRGGTVGDREFYQAFVSAWQVDS